jgi:hypothetical protein
LHCGECGNPSLPSTPNPIMEMEGESSPLIGTILLVVSAAFIRAAVYILTSSLFQWSDNDPTDTVATACGADNNNIDVVDGSCPQLHAHAGFHFSTMMPLSFIPILIFLMVRYVSLRLYQRN